MNNLDLATQYRAYLDCLNARDWDALARFVHADVQHNGRAFGVAGYRAMLEQDVRDIPDLRFTIGLLACDPPVVSARLLFDCRPAGHFLGLPVQGRRVTFAENVMYEFVDRLIVRVWSVVDRAAIAAQLSADTARVEPEP
ncbi:ester cyclase [Lichenihabitans sp. Uapishka_5]|uniref:ester cyclase n=1 Tax=Lichenihabitans sp. Uapishka_5 TaxID=3037302 RepID=UPI0029E7F314|nr:ester cyclase [Lichenihabitans sp. Uapishka_5]MDX7952181.1 ester cyclase [Lichenihabitans sp. Uapishka_5]